MAGRWRTAQRRKRWTDHAALLPPTSLPSLEPWPILQAFAKQLQLFGLQPSTYAQLTQVKNLGNNLLAVLQFSEEEVRISLRVFVELLFVENSRPLHRGLLSTLSHVPSEHAVPLQNVFQECCQEYGTGGSKERIFSVVAVSSSLASLPQPGVLKEVVHYCVHSIANSLCHDVRSVLQHALEGGRPTPSAMEECQDALSSLYYLLQQFPDKFQEHEILSSDSYREKDFVSCSGGKSTGKVTFNENPQSSILGGKDSSKKLDLGNSQTSESSEPENDFGNSSRGGGDIYGAIVCLLLDVLQTAVLSRDCLVAAGVGLAAAAQSNASKEGLAVMLASTAFLASHSTYKVLSPDQGLSDATGERGMLETAVIAYRDSNLRVEMDKLSEFGRLCFFRGVLTAIPRNVQNVHLLRSSHISSRSESSVEADQQRVAGDGQWQVWTLLYDGILSALCGFCESSVDSHFKFHAVTAMQICLQQMKTSICSKLTHSSFKDFEQSAIRHITSIPPYDPLPAAIVSQVLQLIWNNWEDPLTQTVKQVQVVFDLLVDVQLVHKREMYDNQSGEEGNLEFMNTRTQKDEVVTDSFLRQIAGDLLAAGRYRKGKYVPLASLVLRIGTRKMLQMSPDLLFQTVEAFSDDDVCSSASSFLKTFLERLKEDCWSTEGVLEGSVVARRSWIPAVLSGLLIDDPRLRNNLTTYALPVALQIDNDSLLLILAFILESHGKTGVAAGCSLSWEELEGAPGLPGQLAVEQQVVLLISFLKVARSLALVEGSIEHKVKPANEIPKYGGQAEGQLHSAKISPGMSHAIFCIKGQAVEIPVSLLLLALTHKEDGLRVDAAELMCLNPKTASMPSPLELCFLRIALPLNMRCSSTSFRMRWTSFLKKFFLRVRTAVERQAKAEKVLKSQLRPTEPVSSLNIPVNFQDDGIFQPPLTRITQKSSEDKQTSSKAAVRVEQMQEFMQWLSQMLVSSLYPSAPYERKNMAMEVFNALIEVWSLKQSWEKRSGRYTSSPYIDTLEFSPYHESLLSVDFTLVVVGAVVDSWDRLREGAYRILIRYPTPLPGLDSESNIEGLLKWAKGMVNSPRVRESDAGALAFRLIFRKYVIELGWVVKVHPEPKVVATSIARSDENFEQCVGEVLVQYVESLNDWLQWGIEEGDKDLLKACAHSFVHGVLLVLRYTVEETDWTSTAVQSCSGDLRSVLARLLSLLLRVTSLALWVVSADALNLQEKLGGPSTPATAILDNDPLQLDGIAADIEGMDEEYDNDADGSLAPAEQMVMVGCWLSVKEVSLLLGTVARLVPLPGSLSSDSKLERSEENDSQRQLIPGTNRPTVMLDGKQLEAIGSHFVQVLLSMKHNGAIDKTRTGFIALCDRLLRSSDSWLNKLPEVWLQQLMDHTGAKGQVVDDLLRRSAGIPPAFLALFLAEPDGAPKKLLPVAMRWLIDTCKGFLTDSTGSQGTNIKSELSKFGEDGKELVFPVNGISVDSCVQLGETGIPKALKSRDEGVVPTVHAFNILRMTFHDTNLATDTSGFCAEGLITAIQAFSSSHWEVRNSATLAFTALVHRTIGFLNVYKRESARRAITGFEFFHRYPTLHPFLLQELQSATWQLKHGLSNGSNEGSGLASSLHPSLGPVLIILSRLKPSFINSDVEDWLNPSAFMPYVTQCATQQNLHVRVLASRALAPLVSSEDLFRVMLQLAQSLPVSASRKGSELISTNQVEPVHSSKRVSHGSHASGFHKVFSFNAIHGVLLQMYTLLISNCTSLPDLDLQSKIVVEVSQAVEECLWLGSIRLCSCYMVIGAFLDMLVALLSLAETCQESLLNPQNLINHLQVLLAELSCECLDDITKDLKLHDSTRVGLREKVAKLYFQTMLMRWPFKSLCRTSSQDLGLKGKDAGIELHTDGFRNEKSGLFVRGLEASAPFVYENFSEFAARLKQALVDHSYEVRLAVLKVLKQYCGLPWSKWEQSTEALSFQVDDSVKDFRFLKPLIIIQLSAETHPLCIHRILQVIYAWTLIDRENSRTKLSSAEGQPCYRESVWGSGLSALEVWHSLLNIYNTSKQIKTKEVAVRCLGGSVQRIRSGIVDFMESSELERSPSSISEKHFHSDEVDTNVAQVALLPNVTSSMCLTQDRSSMKDVINMWLTIAKKHSAASEPVNFRQATAEAIVASGLLEDAKWVGMKLAEESMEDNLSHENTDLEWYAKCILSAWCICIKLLEDEDLALRQKLALSLLHVIASLDLQANDVVPAQVEKVIQIGFNFLSAQLGHWREYYDVLAEWVIGSEDDTDLISGDVNLVRRLFDKEIDNHHEEELLFVQLCCLQIKTFIDVSGKQPMSSSGAQLNLLTSLKRNDEVLLSNSSLSLVDGSSLCPKAMLLGTWYQSFLFKWRRRFLKQANLCAQLSVQIKDSMQWVGGVTNHQDTFKSLYRNLLGLLIFADPRRGSEGVNSGASSFDNQELASGLTEVSGLLRQLPLNPLVSNALVQVLQAYEQELHINLGSSDIRASLKTAFCGNFDPLFLIS